MIKRKDDKELDKVVAGSGYEQFEVLPIEELIKAPIVVAEEVAKMLKIATDNFFEVDE